MIVISKYYILFTERKRFYRNVSVYEEKGELYGVKLDHKTLHTPLRRRFLVPSEPLALAVAQEWESQQKYVQLPLMHLTGLCNTVLDADSEQECGRSDQEKGCGASEKEVMTLMDYLPTDTLW